MTGTAGTKMVGAETGAGTAWPTAKLHRLGSEPTEVLSALLLSMGAGVLVSAEAGSWAAQVLLRDGFRPLASEWHCVRDLHSDPHPGDRKSRLALSASLAAWRAHGLRLELTSVREFGLDRLEEELYFPILVRELYARGRAPHGAQNLARFRQLARPHAVVALVRQGGRICGGALLRSEDLSRLDLLVTGRQLDLTRTLVGDVYSLEQGLADCRRAFLRALAVAARQGGWTALSYGADMSWVHLGYVPVVVEKLRWTDAVLATAGKRQPYFRSGAAPGADGTGLLLSASAGGARFERVGAEQDQYESLTARLTRIARAAGSPT
ncbi:hypothetical protein DN069_30915 [Streptacidiphilus pinicola]|uniref:Uncharacterized protein n=1 Tax=Streptacidiphilus pinicola TaxID=2219663 RepID=A0A2X0IA12_9ACTN|nr:hypothetical protein [Streptacidiphilus pinicola]RAG81812.1 hypothetical protein DN069_30915 [Streptacidiphilus pinicola]